MINSENIHILTRLNKAFRVDGAYCVVLLWATCCTIALYNAFIIIILYMFRATLCSSSGDQIVLIQHLV